MPGPYFGSDKCKEVKCLDPFLVRTNARRTNAWTIFRFGQMPEPTFSSDNCQGDKCLDPHLVRANVRRTNAWSQVHAFVLRGICPSRHLSFDAFVQAGQMPGPGICPTRYLFFEAFVC